MTDVASLTLILVIAAPFSAPLLFFGRTRWRGRAIDHYARRAGLAWDEVAESLIPRFVRREVAWLLCTAAAYAITAAGLLAWRPDSIVSLWLPGLLVIVLAEAFGQVWAGVRYELRDTDAPRFARIGVPTLEDYVSPLTRRWARVGTPVGVGVVVAVLGLALLDPWGAQEWSSLTSVVTVVMLALTILAWALQPVLTRIVLQHGQPARNPAELAWADALRAELLSDLRLNPMDMSCLAACGAAALVLDLGPASPSGGEFDVWWVLLMLAVTGVALVIGIVASAQRMSGDSSYYLTRLWPEIVHARRMSPSDQVRTGHTVARPEPEDPAC